MAGGLTVRLAAVRDADYQHRQHLILQGIDHPPVANAKPIAGLALQGFDVPGGAGISRQRANGIQNTAADFRVKRVDCSFRLALILDCPGHSGAMPYRASNSSCETPRGRPAASHTAIASLASLASWASSMASSAS